MFALLAVLGCIGAAVLLADDRSSYGHRLEEYIASHKPIDVSDVDRLTVEYDRKSKGGYL